jgi:large subunit ribosomal protein L25
MAEILHVQERAPHGKHHARRLRKAGSIPAILYGHGERNIPLAVLADELSAVIRHGRRVVELTGLVNEKALIREVQWDTFGVDVLHLDLARVSEHERVQVRVSVEMKGQAPGAKAGGVVEQFVHEVEIDCEALSIPDKLLLSVNELELEGQLLASQIQLPPGVALLTDADVLVAHCVKPAEEQEPLAGAGEGAEPELIGRKAGEEDEEE